MRVIVIQAAGLDKLTELQISKLKAGTQTGFVDAVNSIGVKTNSSKVLVKFLEGPGQRTRTKSRKKDKTAAPKPKPDAL